jgi:hypothetical protein
MTEYQLCAGKRCLSYREAHQQIADARRHNQRNHMKTIPKRAYHCDVCGTWHLTSKTDKTKREYGYRAKD